MSQFDFGTIDPNVKTGTQLAADLNQWRTALHSTHAGAARPAYVTPGMLWVDQTSPTQWSLKLATASGDTAIGGTDPTTGVSSHAGRFTVKAGYIGGLPNIASAPLAVTSSSAEFPAIALNKTGVVVWMMTVGSANFLYVGNQANLGPPALEGFCMRIDTSGTIHARAFVPITTATTNAVPLTDALAGVLKLRGVRGVNIETDREELALTVEDTERAFPEAMSEVAPGGKSINYMALAAPIVEAIRELDARLKTLEGTPA